MSKQKKSETKKEEHHSLMEIAGEKAAALKDAIIEGKNKIVSVTEEKFESVKKAIHDYTAPAEKAAVKKSIKKIAKKVEKKVASKKPVKKIVKKVEKKVEKKVASKKPTKSIAKKAVKKAVKKIAKEITKKK